MSQSQLTKMYVSCLRCLTFGIMSVTMAGFFLQLMLLFVEHQATFYILCVLTICSALVLSVRSWLLLNKIGLVDLYGSTEIPCRQMLREGSSGLMEPRQHMSDSSKEIVWVSPARSGTAK